MARIALVSLGTVAIGQLVVGVPLAQDLVTVPPPREFRTSSEHYEYLLERAGGGTRHTMQTIPQWSGLWDRGGNTVGEVFRDEDGHVREGVLTPAYEAQHKERRREIEETGRQQYDRLTHCEPPGYPRNLREPYTREFVNLPEQSWQLNDFMNETRRIYIGREHVNHFGTHSWLGDTIGFWDGDKLITHTVDVLPVDYFRSEPLTSNQFESVEVWEMKTLDDGTQRLEVQATFYDPLSLARPINVVYAYVPAKELMAIDMRIRHWECELSSNSYLTEDGSTNFFLPGEPGFKDPRGASLFPDLPGQSRDPEFNTTFAD
ncbi:MAG: hypothetical protein PVF50_09855 [Gammaproteobacteria bacterium]